MKTIREQAEDRRRVKLGHVQRQIKTGKLLVRQMTAEERDGSPVFPVKLQTPETAGPQ